MNKKVSFIFAIVISPLFGIWGNEISINSEFYIQYSLQNRIIDQSNVAEFVSTEERNNFYNDHYSFQLFFRTTEEYLFGRNSRFFLDKEILSEIQKNPDNIYSILTKLYKSDRKFILSKSDPKQKIENTYKKINNEFFPFGEEYLSISSLDGGFAPQSYSINLYLYLEGYFIRVSLYYHDYLYSIAEQYPEIFIKSNAGYRFREPVVENINKYHSIISSQENRPEKINKLFDYWDDVTNSIKFYSNS